MADIKNIVVVGGGAGGFELATKLGKKYGQTINITLVDCNYDHSWKPLLHEIATGALDEGVNSVNYLAHGRDNNFKFQIGTMCSLNKDEKTITLKAIYNKEGELIVNERLISYDLLVLAIGSISNDFNIEGVKENCIFLDTVAGAQSFRRKMLDLFLKFSAHQSKEQVSIAIVGAGATGVELSAEIYNAIEKLYAYGFQSLTTKSVKITLIEAGNKILPALSDRLINAVNKELVALGVDIKLSTVVQKATESGFLTTNGFVEADLMVWAAGIKASEFLLNLGLENNRLNQIVVKSTLQTTVDDNIFAIGDCASFIQADGKAVPPRAQAAHQMADLVFKNIKAILDNEQLKNYKYVDYGSLVSLSNYSTIGNLMGNLTKGSLMIEGRIARITYISLYKMHQIALFGYFKTFLLMLVGGLNKVLKPKLKLH